MGIEYALFVLKKSRISPIYKDVGIVLKGGISEI